MALGEQDFSQIPGGLWPAAPFAPPASFLVAPCFSGSLFWPPVPQDEPFDATGTGRGEHLGLGLLCSACDSHSRDSSSATHRQAEAGRWAPWPPKTLRPVPSRLGLIPPRATKMDEQSPFSEVTAGATSLSPRAQAPPAPVCCGRPAGPPLRVPASPSPRGLLAYSS